MQACLNRIELCTGHSTVVDGIIPHKSPLFKRGRNVVMEVILLHFRVRPFCVVVSSSLWNQRSRVRMSEPELIRHSALQLFGANIQLHHFNFSTLHFRLYEPIRFYFACRMECSWNSVQHCTQNSATSLGSLFVCLDQATSKKDQRKNDRHQRTFLFSFSVNEP